MLDIVTQKNIQDKVYVIKLKGHIDTLCAPEFDAFFSQCMAQQNFFYILEASGLHHLSSAGISSILRLSKKLQKSNGAVAFVGLSHEISLLFSFFSLEKEIPLFLDIDVAIHWINQKVSESEHVIKTSPKPFTPLSNVPKEIKKSQPLSPTSKYQDAHAVPVSNFLKQQEAGEVLNYSNPPSTKNIQPTQESSTIPEGSDQDFFFPTQSSPSLQMINPSQKTDHYLMSSKVQHCPGCGLKLRFYRTGNHLCPGCGHTIEIKHRNENIKEALL